MYQHVDLLNANGFHAAIVHRRAGYRSPWFRNATRIVYTPFDIRGRDILVFPEIDTAAIAAAPPVRKVIFNQNAYYTFRDAPLDDSRISTAYTRRDVVATIVVSGDSEAYLRYAFPSAAIFRVRNSVDSTLFFAPKEKKKQICFMPRKQSQDARQVLSILKCRNALGGFRIVPIDNCTHEQTAAILRESAVFLSFGHPEGLPLPLMEAMACACVTIGYHGMGGHEYFHSDLGMPIDLGDVIGLARAAEAGLEELVSDPTRPRATALRANRLICTRYSLAAQRAELLACWHKLLEKARNPVYGVDEDREM